MKIETRPAMNESEILGIDEESTSLPDGVNVVDTGEEPIFCLCPVGDCVLTSDHPDLIGTFLVQNDGQGSCFVRKIA